MSFLKRVEPYKPAVEEIKPRKALPALNTRHTTVRLSTDGSTETGDKLLNHAKLVLDYFTYSLGTLTFSGPNHKVEEIAEEFFQICGAAISYYKVATYDSDE